MTWNVDKKIGPTSKTWNVLENWSGPNITNGLYVDDKEIGLVRNDETKKQNKSSNINGENNDYD